MFECSWKDYERIYEGILIKYPTDSLRTIAIMNLPFDKLTKLTCLMFLEDDRKLRINPQSEPDSINKENK